VPTYDGRLELTWTNKHLRLLAHEDGSYEWVTPSDYRVAEVRLLHDVASVGDVGGKRAADNLLICGDALNALTSLCKLPEFSARYRNQVKLCYIDPPFNTQQSFLNYDDALEHSVWLTMIRDRLLQVKELLAPDGTVWLHLDDAEVHRARAVLDELFGPEQHLGTVIWQKADGPRNDLPNFSVDHDTIIVYGRSPSARLVAGERDVALNSIYKTPDGDDTPWYDDNPTAPSAIRNQTWVYAIQSPMTGELLYPANGRCWASKQETVMAALSEYAPYELRVLDDDAKRAAICGVTEAALRKDIPALMLATSLDEARTRAERRRAAGHWPEFILRPKGTIGRKRPQPTTGTNTRTLWFNTEVGHNREAKAEIKALFPGLNPFATPKPERLLRKIISVATEPGDLVLDCFVGSGTTAAVAHKMGRRWVGIDREASTFEAFALPRLRKVVAGEDDGGVTFLETVTGDDLPEGVKPGEARAAARLIATLSKSGALDGIDGLTEVTTKELVKGLRAVDRTRRERVWTGGGGFRVLQVAPSMFEVDDGLVFLADWMTNGKLSEATAAQLGFEYEPDAPFSGRKGRTRLAVIDGIVNEAVVRLLVSALPERERVVVCGTGIDTDARPILRELRPGSTLRKIPAALLDEYRSSRQLRLSIDNAEAVQPAEVKS
jgi:DNA modification methylase